MDAGRKDASVVEFAAQYVGGLVAGAAMTFVLHFFLRWDTGVLVRFCLFFALVSGLLELALQILLKERRIRAAAILGLVDAAGLCSGLASALGLLQALHIFG